jgi:glycosyltransferase involved in cell wall biosynthesis
VDDGSDDNTAEVAERGGARLIGAQRGGNAVARNLGNRAAAGEWIAFTDADCLATRHWLRLLLAATQRNPAPLGVAGEIVGYQPATPAARFVELNGGIAVGRHAVHPTFPYPHHANALYRRSHLLAVKGLDERLGFYPGPDLHRRLHEQFGGELVYAPTAVVFHRHPATWPQFMHQQQRYGIGYAQHLLRYRDELAWHPVQEASAWLKLLGLALQALRPGDEATQLVRQGRWRKELAFRRGFLATYWSRRERRRWTAP